MFRSFPAEEHVFGNPQRPCPPGNPTAVEGGPLSVTLSGPLTLHLAFYAFPNAAGFLTRRRKILPTSPLRWEFGLSWSQARVASSVYGKDGEKQGEVWRPAGEQPRPARGHSVCHPTRSPDVGQCLGGSSPARKTQTAHAHMTLEHSSSQESSFAGGSFSYSLTVPWSSHHPPLNGGSPSVCHPSLGGAPSLSTAPRSHSEQPSLILLKIASPPHLLTK